ncbi:MAG: molybdopterin-dependent oxidoreductase [Hyphomicrobiaceae bacterium]|nr:molybdopterin-dependent oxidoreductase [Hyphomicrobiaceae bacterium]
MLHTEPTSSIRTACPYCGVGCGVIATVERDGAVSIKGDPDHPANFGRLCSKGSALADTIGTEGRLTRPVVDGQPATWDAALDRVAGEFRRAIAEHGPDSVAFYVSGQILTEDYYVANKLMKGFIGSANIDTNSRLCMASSVAGHRRAFGTDTVPGTYEDLEQADLVVLVGSNLAWCHPVLYQRLAAAKKARPELNVVVIDPRRTATCELADTHLAIRPGSDVALFNGLLDWLASGNHLDRAYIDAHTIGFEAAVAEARLADPVGATGLERAAIDRFYGLFAGTERVVTVYSQGVNQSEQGTDKVNAILNCHLATGRIGRPGMGPFSVTGQPNAMGGREVGGLANQLAGHLDLADPEHRAAVKTFWRAPAMAEQPGLKAVDLFKAVDDGRIKALWIMSTNPVVSLPDADRVAAALAKCPFVVVSDVVETDTTRFAHVLLPASAWGEKDGTVTNSERRISRQRAFMPAPGAARPDWWQMADVGRRMGFAEAFAYGGVADVFREYAAQSAFRPELRRDFDIGACAGLSDGEYETLEPFQWPWPAGAGAERERQKRFFAEGGFYTADRRARFVAVRPRALATTSAFPLIMNTGRVRDQWHTMTRSGLSAKLSAHLAEPYCEIATIDAARLGIRPADLVEVTTAQGRAIVRALVSDRQQAGTVFVPIHWTGRNSSAGRVDALVAAVTDPISGQPASKATACRVARFQARWYGFAVSAVEPENLSADYWVTAKSKAGWRIELGCTNEPEDWAGLADAIFGTQGRDDVERIAYHDAGSGRHRVAVIRDGRLVGALYAAPEPVEVSRAFAAKALEQDEFDAGDRMRLLAGRPGQDRPDPGAIVCACFEVGVNTIMAAITQDGLATVDAIGAALRAGTNCGSCRSEIQRMISHARVAQAG